jgi:hypothetical protein
VRKLISGAAMLAAALSVAGLAFGAGNAVSYKLSARLTAGAEVPKQVIKVPGAKGTFTGTLTGRKLTWKLTFTGLSGAAAQAHIHLGKAGVAGNVIVPLCAPCRSGVHGKTTVSAATAKAIKSNKTYVNVHTAMNAAGEIRGQLRATA